MLISFDVEVLSTKLQEDEKKDFIDSEDGFSQFFSVTSQSQEPTDWTDHFSLLTLSSSWGSLPNTNLTLQY